MTAPTVDNSRLIDWHKLEELPDSLAWEEGKALVVNSTEDGYDFQERDLWGLSNVDIENPVGGEAILYNASTELWENTEIPGGWDMLKSTYDPNNKSADAFSMGNMDETATEKIMTFSERTKLASVESWAEANTVDSVNGEIWDVILDADDISDTTTVNKYTTASDISKLAWIEDEAQKIYSWVDTEANILALDPFTYIGQTWWSNDVQVPYKAIQKIDLTYAWQQVGLKYNNDTDSFCLSTTQDSQTQNLWQEVFILAYNNNWSGAIQGQEPEVFLSIGAKAWEESFQNVVKVVASDLEEWAVYWINTTNLMPWDHWKVATYWEVRDCNTSSWNMDDILYVDGSIAWKLTNVRPDVNIFPIGRVLKSGSTDGIFFVNTVAWSRVDTETVAVGVKPAYFTGEPTGAFYEARVDDLWTIPTVTQNILCPDNTTVGIWTDSVTEVFPDWVTINAWFRDGQIEYSINSWGWEERLYMEVYEADSLWVPIDSGITTEPVGDLWVRPIAVLVSSLLNSDTWDIFKEKVRGLLENNYTLSAGSLLRFHILAEKVGTAWGNKSFTIYQGSDHDTFINSINNITIDDVSWLEEALEEKLQWKYPYILGTYPANIITSDNAYLMVSNKETSDYPFPTPVWEPAYLMDTASFSDASSTSVVHSGHKYTFTEAWYLSQLRVWVPELSGTTNYRFNIVDVTDPVNPIYRSIPEPVLTENAWTVIAANRTLITTGTELIVYVDALNSNSNSQVTWGWTFNWTSNSTAPSAEGWNRTSNNNIVRIDKTDLDTVDRSTELQGIIAWSEIQFVDTLSPTNSLVYETISAPVDQWTYYEYSVFLRNSNGNISSTTNCTMTATIPVPSVTKYSQEAGFWTGNQPDFASVEGFLQYDGVNQPWNTDVWFGIDIRFQKLETSPDWDFMSSSGITSSGWGWAWWDASWGNILWTLSDQTDLQAALDDKVNKMSSAIDNRIIRANWVDGDEVQISQLLIENDGTLTAPNDTLMFNSTTGKASFFGAADSYGLNVKGSWLNARMSFQWGAWDNPWVQLQNDTSWDKRVLWRLNESGSNGTEMQWYTRDSATQNLNLNMVLQDDGTLNAKEGVVVDWELSVWGNTINTLLWDIAFGKSIPEKKVDISASWWAISASNSWDGIRLVDSSSTNTSPSVSIIGKRSDTNWSRVFSGQIALAWNYTNWAVQNNKVLGNIIFGWNHTDGTEGNIKYWAGIYWVAEWAFNSISDMPTGLSFRAWTNWVNIGENANIWDELMRVSSNGNVSIWTWGIATAKLEIGWTPWDDWIKFPDGTLQTTAAVGGWWSSTSINFEWSSYVWWQDSNPFDLSFNSNWTKLFVMWLATDTVYQYSLSTAYDLSTLTYDSVSFNVNSQEATPGTIDFNLNGTKMYVAWTNKVVYQYNLSTWFDLSTAAYSWTSLDLTTLVTIVGSIRGLRFADSWNKLLFIDWSTYKVIQINLSTAFDITTASASWNELLLFLSSWTTSWEQYSWMWISDDWTKLYAAWNFKAKQLIEYDLTSSWDLSSASIANSYTVWEGNIYWTTTAGAWKFAWILNSADSIVKFTLN